jgi:hypothetical protein
MKINVSGKWFDISDDANPILFANQIKQIQGFYFDRTQLEQENIQLKQYVKDLEFQLKIKADRKEREKTEEQKQAEEYIAKKQEQMTQHAADLAMKQIEKAFNKSGFDFSSK